MEPRFTPNDLEIVAEQPLYDGFFCMRKISIRHRLFEGGWSRTFDRELCLRGDAVGVLLYDPVLEKFALVEQVRIGVINRPQSPWLLELVAGMLDKEGESHEAVACREVREEAGLEVMALEPMLAYFSSPGGSTEYFSLFCGRVNLSQDTSSPWVATVARVAAIGMPTAAAVMVVMVVMAARLRSPPPPAPSRSPAR